MTVTTAQDDALGILSGMAVSLRHEIDLDFVLAELATGVRHTLDAERVSVLLLDDDGRLIPAVAVARQHNDELWQRFRRMPPIALDDVPGARRALAQGHVLLIEDASASPLVPTAWQRTFSLGSLAVAPLVVEGSPAGLVAVEYGQIDATCTPTQLALLEGMAALAAVALRAGRHRSHAQRVELLTATVAQFAGTRTTRAVAEHALTALLECAHATTGLFALLAADAADVLAVRGPQLPEPGTYPLAALPDDLVWPCRTAWSEGAASPVTVELAGRGVAVLPVGTQPVAVVLLPLVPSLSTAEVLGELQLIAAAAAVQLRSARLEERRAWDRRAMSLVSDLSSAQDAGSLPTFVDEACALLLDAGVPAPAVVVDRSIVRTTGLAPARSEVARVITRWRRAGNAARARAGGHDVIPLTSAGRVLGAVVTAAAPSRPLSTRAAHLVHVLGDGIGQVVSLAHTGELELRTADCAAHTAVASRAYREAMQLLGLLSNSLHVGAADSPRAAGAEALVGQVRRLLRDATEVLAPAAAPQPDLRVALTAVAKQICAHGGPEASVRQVGTTPALDAAVQVAVVHAVQRLLALLREQRAVAAAVCIERSDTEVLVTIRTDELIAAAGDGPGLLAARRDARSWLAAVGGSLELSYDGPVHCFVVRAPARVAESIAKSGTKATSAQTGQAL